MPIFYFILFFTSAGFLSEKYEWYEIQEPISRSQFDTELLVIHFSSIVQWQEASGELPQAVTRQITL